MAESNPSISTPSLEYRQQLWGDLIVGTKQELQSIGIGAGLAFPGEPDGPKRWMRVRDPRGFLTKIEREGYGDRYIAQIPFPGREDRIYLEEWIDYAPGVLKCSTHYWGDSYIGSAEALVAARLVESSQLPGQPGMGKHTVTISAEGSVCGRVHNVTAHAGMKTIQKRGMKFVVDVIVGREEQTRRSEVMRHERYEYEQRMKDLPRPAPLIDLSRSSSSAEQKKSVSMTPGEFRHEYIRLFDVAMDINLRRSEESGFAFNDDSLRRINKAFSELRRALAEGGVVPAKAPMRQDGNVVYLGR